MRWGESGAQPRIYCALLECKGVSLCSESSCECGWLGCRGGGCWLVVGAVLEHREDDVAAAAGQEDHGGVVALALGALAIVVGLGDRVRVRGDPGGVEQRVFQPLVARACGELSTDRGSGSSRDWRDPGIGPPAIGGGTHKVTGSPGCVAWPASRENGCCTRSATTSASSETPPPPRSRPRRGPQRPARHRSRPASTLIAPANASAHTTRSTERPPCRTSPISPRRPSSLATTSQQPILTHAPRECWRPGLSSTSVRVRKKLLRACPGWCTGGIRG